jgi:thymidylate synthase
MSIQHWEIEYLIAMKLIVSENDFVEDRTNVGTYQKCGVHLTIPLDPFPIVQGKKVMVNPLFSELRWFLSGSTNILPLLNENCNIWTSWAWERWYKRKPSPEDLRVYKAQLLDGTLPEEAGELGPVYGKQWRDFNGVDQIQNLIHDLRVNPYSRRHIVTAWNPTDIPGSALPPCHAFWQVHVHRPTRCYVDPTMIQRAENTGKAISLTLTQRSADMFLGVPFNISSYAALAHWLSHMTGYAVGNLYMNFGNAHVYQNHLDALRQYDAQVFDHTFTEFPNPILEVKGEWEPQFSLVSYQHAPFIYAPVAV